MRIEDVEVGKEYRIRQWDDMEREFGLSEMGSIKCKSFFVKEMKHLCGKKCIVNDKGVEKIYIDIEDSAESSVWNYTADMIEPICEENKMPIEIKPGYIVTIKDKNFSRTIDAIALPAIDGSLYFANNDVSYDYKKDFNGLGFKTDEYEIVKVYGNPKKSVPIKLGKYDRDILYDANRQKMTKSQIERALGHQIEIVEE